MKVNTWNKRNNGDNVVYETLLQNCGFEMHAMIINKIDGWYYKTFNPYALPPHVKMNATNFNEAQAEFKKYLRVYFEEEINEAKLRRDSILESLCTLQYNENEI